MEPALVIRTEKYLHDIRRTTVIFGADAPSFGARVLSGRPQPDGAMKTQLFAGSGFDDSCNSIALLAILQEDARPDQDKQGNASCCNSLREFRLVHVALLEVERPEDQARALIMDKEI